MAPRAYWKGYLRLSLVSCPIALYPATSEREKVSFNQINRETGHRVRYRKVDEQTGEEVPSDQIIKGYEVAKGEYIEITDDELQSVALESTKTIEIDEFVPKTEIDELYNIRPYYIAPDGKVGQDAFVVIRDAIEQMKMVAIGRVVLTSREHVIAIVPRGKGMMGTLLRFPYEVRDAGEYFDDIPERQAAQGHAGPCAPHRRNQKRAFQTARIRGPLRARPQGPDREKSQGRKDRGAEGAADRQGHQPDGRAQALRSGGRRQTRTRPRPRAAAPKGRKKIEGQKEMLLPISGKKAAREAGREEQRKPARSNGRQRKAG